MAILKRPEPKQDYIWYPLSDAQFTATHSKAQLLMFGGSAGSYKTNLVVADAAREYDNPNLRGLILRESWPQLEKNVLPEMRNIYPQMGAYYVGGTRRVWTFASGAQIRLGVIEREDDIRNYQGGNYSYIGIDESTHHPENHLRDLLPWFRTTDPSLFKRIRLATNPGGVGAPWHLSVFLRNKCPFHFPESSVEPGRIYKGTKWYSDGKPIPYTVAFVPGRYDSGSILGEDYAETLRTQRGERAEQLLSGCWCALEGAYFSFLREDYKAIYQEIDDQWWWTHFLSIDYGFGNSSAAAGMYAIAEDGTIYKTREMVEKSMVSVQFAEKICEEWVTPAMAGGEPPRIACCYMDPANNQHSGTGRSNMQMMAEVFERYGISVIPAAKGPGSRADNALRLYRMLQVKRFVLCNTVPRTFTALATRMHGKKSGEFEKTPGDPLDDLADETAYAINTWVEGTVKPSKIATEERIAKLKKDGVNEMSLQVIRTRMEREAQKSSAPVSMSRPTIGQRIIRR